MKQLNSTFSFLSGALLALMIFINSRLAWETSPLWASLIAHFIGSIVGLVFCLTISRKIFSKEAPKWSYLGGVLGAVVVVLASMTVNSSLGLAGTISLMILGQVFMGLITDAFGAFGMPKKNISLNNYFHVLLTLTGSIIIIFFAR